MSLPDRIPDPDPIPQLLSRVRLRNYKSIASCDVAPERLTYLVGPNGAGKSNFIDALRLTAESLRVTLDHAIRDRGGIDEVRRRSGGHPTHFAIRLDFRLEETKGYFAFEVGSRPRGGFGVDKEECEVQVADRHARYTVRKGEVTQSTTPKPPPAASDRLYLVTMSGLELFRPVFDALAGMGFYTLNPEVIRDLQSPDPGYMLSRDGSNLASVLARIEAEDPDLKERIQEYLARVVPGVNAVRRVQVGPKETLEFRQLVRGAKHPWRFHATNMSDGTLRALGVLIALFQGARGDSLASRVIGIEEPELALHPAAAGVLTDCFADATARVQTFVTSHSPELLDRESVAAEQILAVSIEQGETQIAPVDEAARSALRDRLYTAGELLRMDQIQPDPSAIPSSAQMQLFQDDD